MTFEWTAHEYETRPWRQVSRAGSRADRMLSEVVVSLPPLIAASSWVAPPSSRPALDAAARAIITLDAGSGSRLGALGRLLIRTEAVSSSKIEDENASLDDYARATVGIRANASATSMVAAAEALTGMVDAAGSTGLIDEVSIFAAHRVLMADDPVDDRYAGAYRSMQNWIGGSDHSPRDAVHVPPPAEIVPALMADLIAFSNRSDLDPIVQAAIAHAQFESIHPFTDGNGRIGRALINAILRRRGLTTTTVVPVASALVADRERYFSLVNGYREGALAPFVDELARACVVAAPEAMRTAASLEELPAAWAAAVRPRAGSAADLLLRGLLDHPILTTARALEITGRVPSSVGAALRQLVDAQVLAPLTERRRDQVWVAADILDELADLEDRIGTAMLAASDA
ncbi:Fic family protein [Rathayibacter sp. VKM Ac-2803]|uniref:Fic family protein n=1 Tax=unclassified Rathayibacter TaxID=2609250 RepID=UPI00135875C8|nr:MULTISPECIES: Fic family protein [unclassified Rathayibacter]MWV47841.1 Fic family protein [Rathayibacter sp. VKM Ac-2803]MWV58946.1 Fic family protein [Rathayibacter sp. VKM Ac-2754]